MIYKIVASGYDSFKNIYTPEKEEVLIAVDGGLEAILKLNNKLDTLYPVEFYGDFDSFQNNPILDKKIKYHKYNSIKDKSDLELAIEDITKKIKEEDKIIIYNATGKRLDHEIANIHLLEKYSNYHIRIIDDYNMIYIIKDQLIIEKNQYKYISFFSYEDTYITLKGFKYELDNYLLKANDNLCLSNEIISIGKVITSKKLLVIQSKDS